MKFRTRIVYAFNRALKIFFKLKILETTKSIDLLNNSNFSLARFGDGEMNILMGGDIHFQQYNRELASTLRKILTSSNHPNLRLGIPLAINTVQGYKPDVRIFWSKNMDTGRIHWMRLCGFKREFLNASLTRCYFDYEEKLQSKVWFENIIKLWAGNKILIIEGQSSRLGVGNGLFSNALQIERIICPGKNAWDHYDQILSCSIKQGGKHDLILASLGPTATVLAHDISKLGFRIIDIGHLNAEYESYLRNGSAELQNHTISEEEYQQQIVAIINE